MTCFDLASDLPQIVGPLVLFVGLFAAAFLIKLALFVAKMDRAKPDYKGDLWKRD